MGEAGPLGDVGDAGIQESVPLEDLLCRATRRARVSTPLRDRGPLGFSFVAAWPSSRILFPCGLRAAVASLVPLSHGRGGLTAGGSCSVSLEQQHARRGPAARGHHGRPRLGTWRSPASCRSWSTAS